MSDKFWDHVDKSKDCWEWTGSLNGKGYGQIYINGKSWMAHRFSWTISNSDIPKDKFVLHSCDNRKCVNPSHLFIGTHEENMQDMIDKGRQPKQRGALNNYSKLKESDVALIKDLYRTGMHYKEISKLFAMSSSHVRNICTGRFWGHVL